METAKIPDPDLRRFAEAAPEAEQRSVIVELEPGPPPKPRPQRPRPPGARPDPLEMAYGGHDERAMDQLERRLGELGLGEDLVRLDAAQAFVVTVRPDQLRLVAGLPLVGVIRPNRTHRTSSPT